MNNSIEREIIVIHKRQLARELANRSNITIKEATYVINNLVEIIAKHLQQGEEVRIEGFCTFTLSERKETETVNPQTLKPMTIPATQVVRAVVSKGFKQLIRKK